MLSYTSSAANDESRNASVGVKRSFQSLRSNRGSKPGLSSKRRRRNPPVGEQDIRDFVPSGSNFSVYSGIESSSNHVSSEHSSYSDQSPNPQAEMDTNTLGRNRLKSGFYESRTLSENSAVGKEPTDGTNLVMKNSHRAISLSDDDSDEDMQDSETEGGMILNIQGNSPAPIVISDDEDEGNREDEEEEPGEILESSTAGSEDASKYLSARNSAERSPQDDQEPSFIIDPLPSQPQILTRLTDLQPSQLEKQLKYAFWNLERDQIDLNRPALCLYCHGEGHIEDACHERTCVHCGTYDEHDGRLCPTIKRCDRCREPGHKGESCMRNTTIPCDLCSQFGHVEEDCALIYHAKNKIPPGQIKLWISCCLCASKMHLVGDCPKADTAQASRWSLKSLNSAQVLNLSMETGTRKLEYEAENRGLRPAGLQIKGRAAQMQAKAAEAERQRAAINGDDSEDDEFWGRPPPHRSDQYRPHPSGRYDRFDAPSNERSYRPPRNSFYATDSFGRPRSHSPRGYGGDYFDDRRRRRSPLGNDSWRPGDSARRRQLSPPRNLPRPPAAQAPTRPKANVQIQLPRRPSGGQSSARASASALSQAVTKLGDSAQSSNAESSSQNGSKKKHRKRPKKGGREMQP